MQPPRLNLRVHLFAAAFIFGSLQIAAPSLHAQQLVISEIMAVNDSTLADEDGDFSDWIEIWNRGAGSVNLEGWHLTDNPADLTKWTFPAETLEADLLLIVFASQKDQSVTGMPLHTNFKLSGGGEYLALVEPDGSTIAAEFEPAFPALGPDESYGLQFTSTSTVSIVSHGASARSWAPADGSLGTNWTIWGGIDDSSWRQGSTGIGFDSSGSFDPLIATDVEDLMTGPDRGTCYIRIPFFYQSISNLNGVSLDIRYDDGFVAYLNGVELASRNAPGSPQWDSMATVNKDDLTAGNTEQIQVLGADTLLSPGTNLLAIHGLNLIDNPFLKNFLIDPALSGVTVAESLSVLAVPTPGTANGQAAATVNFAPPGGMYSSAPVVELSSDPAGSPVYYTLDGSQPTTNAMLYSAPIVPAGGAQIRARSIESSGLEGPIRSEHFIVLAADLLSFSSDLPLVVIENFGGGDALADGFIPFALEIFEAQGGRTSLTNSAALATRAGVRKRGSSTIGRDKVSYNVEAWNELDDDKTIAPLGMPGEADWILYGPYNFDRAMVRNSLIYELSRQAGPYAVRSRFVELFRNINGGNLSYAEDYRGIYIWMEKIKRDPNRVDIDAISPSDTVEPDISGGYMLKIDRADAGDSGFSAGGQSLLYLDPKESEMETDYVAQAAWLQNYINQFGNALGSTNFQDPATGYAAYFDTVEAIDHFILNEFMTRNPDALVLSTYLHKPRSGKITFGPIWDFDRTMGCADDGRSANPAVWTVSKFAYGWWNNLFDDADFWQGMIDRWQALRGDVLSLSNILSVVDSQSAELQEAEARNFGKWSGIPPRGGSYAAEVDLLRTWLSNRVEWIDDQFLDPPLIVPGSSVFEPGTLLTMSGPGGSTIYYTLDGSDPRGFNGVPAPGASLYSLPFPLNAAAVIVARAWDGQPFGEPQSSAPWSAPTREIYVCNPAELALTEVMYNPRQADTNELAAGLSAGDFEFIELQHTGLEVGSLLGVSFSDGITFDFTASDVISLSPGEHVVVVRNLDAFSNRHAGWATMKIAGEFTGSLNNDGEAIALSSAVATGELWRVTYDDKRGWPVAVDGAGHSLVPLDDDPRLLDYGGNWRASAWIDGSPGVADPLPPDSVMLNEFMAHTDFSNPALPEYDSDDWIELYNMGTAAVSLTDWYLSDDANALTQWAIPASNVIAGGAWLSFDEVTGFHNPITNGFGLDKAGEGVFLSYLPGTSADRVVDSVRFKGQERTASLGRYADGGKYWRALDLTRDTTNAVPPEHIVISEIMYHPPATNVADNLRDEFIEIFNPLGVPVDLWTEAGAWRIAGGVTCTFPTNTTLGDGEAVLLVSFDPADASVRNGFLATYALTNGEVRLFGPCTGLLSDRGERVALERPQAADGVGDPVSWVIVDEVIYYDRGPWADAADGTGQSLQRTGTGGAGRDPANWIALAPTPGGLSKIVITAPVAAAPYFLPIEADVNAFVDVLQVSGAVQEVRFYHGTNGFGTDASAPYTASLSYTGPPGDVSLRASVEDVVGVNTSTPVRIIAQAIDSAQGARDVTDFSAVLQGGLTGGGVAEATFAWGPIDGGTNLNDWTTAQSVGTVGTGTFALAVENLQAAESYVYRVHAENVNGETWSSPAAAFSTPGFGQWSYRMRVTFACTGSGLALSNFPVLVKLSEGLPNFSYGQFASDEAFDLRFAAADGEVLSYEIEQWDTNGISAIWLRLPELTNNTPVDVYWGFNPAVSAPPRHAVDGSTWGNAYESVWHLNEDDHDATLNVSVITDEGSSNAAGVVAGGRSLDGSGDALRLALAESWYESNRESMTISLWVRPLEVAGSTMFSTGGDTNLYVSINTFFKKWVATLSGSGVIGDPYEVDQWQHCAFVFEPGSVSMVQNDLGATLIGAASTLCFADPPAVGRRLGAGGHLDGLVDDIRVSRVSRSAAWLAAEYASVAEHESFTCYGMVMTQGDADGDQLPDIWEDEMLGGTNAAAGDDIDLDGLDNEGEFLAGTDPTNAASVFTVQLSLVGGEIVVRFPALEAAGPGYEGLDRYYDLERSSNLLLQVWPSVSGYSNILGQGQLVTHSNSVPHPTYFRARTRLE